MANTVKIKNSGNANSVPNSLEFGELAINYNDEVLYYKTSSNAIVSFDLTTSVGSLETDVTDLQVELAMQICG